jgi:ATP-dependent DNA helicase RecG
MPFKLDEKVKSAIRSNLNFTLTASQNQTVNEILLDLQKNYPMHRLLQGDVGCGKTVVCAFAFAASISSGFQAAFMVPTEILAYQHKETFENLFKGLNYKIEVLVSSLGAKSIATIVKGLEDGSIDMVIGTHALIQEKVTFKKLNFVAIDEQHRFGVAQRAILPKKGQNPHYLVMSATPIPRSLALTLYGDLDLSVIKELPQERIIPKTSWVSEEKRPWAVSLIKEQLSAGRQTFVIYPVIEESEDEDLKSLELEYERIKKEFFPFKAAIFHGRLKPKDKLSIARKFYEKEIDILISTTVVEVGVNVYNATTMLVENPERFGLAQLHQLRGRIQRSKYQPYFILISKPEINEEAKSRLGVIAAENDGFKIAEEDLKLRGPGDFFGFLQHGLPELKIANPLKDIELLKEARFEAYKIIKDDPFLEKRQHCQIKSRLKLWLPAVSEYFSEAKAAQG